MLSGEWGCGKTYLLDHQLIENLKNTHVFIRISLFGIDSLNALNAAVKKEWVLKWVTYKSKDKLTSKNKVVKTGKTLLGTATNVIPMLKEIKESFLSSDTLDYLTITPKIGTANEEKIVVLIFDDFERSRLNKVDILGCINEYCENLHFHTIVVANEDKIDSLGGNITYAELKEKIIARTVRPIPDYEAIISSLIDEKLWFDDEYSTFLNENKPIIQSIFTSEEMVDEDGTKMVRPHNIRSLKCALQDFHRLFEELVKVGLPEREQYLYTFISYVMAIKSGLAKEDDKYGYMFSDIAVQKLYPLYSTQKMFKAAKDWIHHGEWNTDTLSYEINLKVRQLQEIVPKDKLRVYRVIDLDEEIIAAGFEGLLQDVYNGTLTLEEYILFIENSYFIREWDISVPSKTDWTKVVEGIKIRFQKNIDALDDEHHVYSSIDENSKYLYTEDEWEAYKLIRDFRTSEVIIFEGNKKLYIDELSKNGNNALVTCRQKRYNDFDDKMVEATVTAYKHSTSNDKIIFADFFYDMWQFCAQNSVEVQQHIRTGFQKLNEQLKDLRQQYSDDGKNIAARQTDIFINKVESLINKLNINTENHGSISD